MEVTKDRSILSLLFAAQNSALTFLNDPKSVFIPLLTNKTVSVSLQESYNAGVKHYEADDFEAAIKYFEQALREYYNEDMECRALCEGPQRFEEYEYLRYKGGLYEAIAGKACFCSLFAYSKMLWILCKQYSDNIVLNSKDCNMLTILVCLFHPVLGC